MACGILVPQLGIEPMPPALETWSFNHWTSMEVPIVPVYFLNVLAGLLDFFFFFFRREWKTYTETLIKFSL